MGLFALDNAVRPIAYVLMSTTIIHGDCLEELKKLEDNSVDAVVTDPPYGLSNTKPAQVADVLKAWVTGDTVSVPAKRGGFMGADWDSFVPPPAVWEECMRVLKPGGHMAVFAGARTQDLMGLSIRLAGFEIRDTLGWVYGSGFPKSMDVSKAIDKVRAEDREPRVAVTSWVADECARLGWSRPRLCKAFGVKNQPIQSWTERNPDYAVIPTWENWQRLKALVGFGDEMDAEVWRLNGRKGTPGEAWEKREVVGVQKGAMSGWNMDGSTKFVDRDITTSHSDAAKRWDGWGTALKPAIEPIILARKPLDGTVAANVLQHGVGGLNIDACRVGMSGADREVVDNRSGVSEKRNSMFGVGQRVEDGVWKSEPAGRFPANVLLDEHAAKEMDEQSGITAGAKPSRNVDYGAHKQNGVNEVYGAGLNSSTPNVAPYADSGGASRFFPVFKYQAKAPKKERPVIYKNNCECEEWQSQQKDTTGSTATAETSWNTSTSGNSTTEKFQQDTISTTSTTTSSTIGSKTLNALAGSTISESTQDAKSETVNGGNHAESAESLSQSDLNTGISAKRDGHSTDDAGHVISEKWYTTSNCEKCGEPRLKVQHATVKPLALMEWLVSLIVPPGGTVLDPFAGSGTTLQAALNKGFQPIGIEQDADYIKLIEQRLAA